MVSRLKQINELHERIDALERRVVVLETWRNALGTDVRKMLGEVGDRLTANNAELKAEIVDMLSPLAFSADTGRPKKPPIQ